jgi:hypothetical protein
LLGKLDVARAVSPARLLACGALLVLSAGVSASAGWCLGLGSLGRFAPE